MIAKEVGLKQAECEKDLAAAEPALAAAAEALNTLNKVFYCYLTFFYLILQIFSSCWKSSKSTILWGKQSSELFHI